jgi:large subunit ribosomal protein L16
MANLQPARTKWRKHRKGKIRGNATTCNTLSFGDFGIQSLDRARLPANQIEAARIAISRSLKRKGKMWMRIFPHTPVTRKPAEVRMGSGKGSVKPGTMLFEVGGVTITVAREAMRLADTKLQVRCRFVAREELEKY